MEKKSKNLHILQDNKFYDEMISEIHARNLVEHNKFLVHLYKKNTELEYIGKKVKGYENLVIIDEKFDLQKAAEGYDKIIFHALKLKDIKQLVRFKKNNHITIYWRQWSNDTNIFLNIARKAFKKQKIESWFPLNLLILFRNKLRYRRIKKALAKIDYVSNWNMFETEQLREYYPDLNPKFFYSVYFRQTYNTQLQPTTNLQKLKIVLGHSGYSKNNHKEFIDFFALPQFNDLAFEVICPLVYGEKEYIEELIVYSKKKLDHKFIYFTEFMPRPEYFKMFEGATIFIFNSIDHNGAGNIFTALAQGGKVFLKKENLMASELKKQNIIFFFSEDLLQNPDLLTEKMSEQDKIHNNQIMTSQERNRQFETTMTHFIE